MGGGRSRKAAAQGSNTKSRGPKKLDMANPDDRAFNLVIKYNVPVPEAIETAGADCRPNVLYARVQRWRERVARNREAEEAEAAAAQAAAEGTTKSPTPLVRGSTAVTPGTVSARKARGKAAAQKEKDTLEKARQMALENCPEWVDRDKTKEAMSHRKKRKSADVCQDNFDELAMRNYRDKQHSNAWKMATTAYHETISSGKPVEHGSGYRAVAAAYNKEFLSSPNARKIDGRALHREVMKGNFGKSPPRRGRPAKVPAEFTRAVATHATMMQVSGEGEASRSNMLPVMHALIHGTKWEGKFDIDYGWRKVKKDHPEIMNPVRAIDHEDRRVEWLSFKIINDWTDAAKKYLLSIGMLKDEPGEICGVQSEVSLVHEDDVNFFLTLDEMHHRYSTKGNRGGSTQQRYATASFPRSGDRVVMDGSFHTTGLYSFTPPLYVFESKAKKEENFKIDPQVCDGLPIVHAKYANARAKDYPSAIAVRHKGSMNTSLWHDFNRKLIAGYCYRGKIAPRPVRDPDTNKMIRGPLIVKTDAGPGRLANEAESLEFRMEMADLGLNILLSLPNGTECTAELDQIFGPFKSRCKKSTVRIAGMKMARRVEARNVAREKKSGDEEVDYVQELKEYLEETGEEEGLDGSPEEEGSDAEEEGEVELQVGKSVCRVSIGNLDLAHIVNGFLGDPIAMRPFDFYFQHGKIIPQWIKVGFLPMTRAAANDPKVRFELGDGGAPEEALDRMEMLEADYAKHAAQLNRLGFNGGVLDLKAARTSGPRQFPAEEEEQIQAIIDGNLLTKAGGLFKIGISIANRRVVLEAARRLAEMAKEKAKAKEQKEQDKKATVEWTAIRSFTAWKSAGKQYDNNGNPKLGKDAAKAIAKVLAPKIDQSIVVSKQLNSMKACVQWLGGLQGGNSVWEAEMQHVVEEVTGSGGPLFQVTTGQSYSFGASADE